MFPEEERYQKIARLGLRVIVAGVLFYLAAGNLNVIANAIQYLFRISQPLWIGVILAMILNVLPARSKLFYKSTANGFALRLHAATGLLHWR